MTDEMVKANRKAIESALREIWADYYADMDNGRMRSPIGRCDFEAALLKLGLLTRDENQWRDWFFGQWQEKSAFIKLARKVERKIKAERGAK